jgi:hypothetical protein
VAAGRSIGGWVAGMLEGRQRATLLTERALESAKPVST